MKIAVVVGHNAKAQGAVRTTDGVTEFEWNSNLAELIQDGEPNGVRIFHRVPEGGYSAEIARVYGQVNTWDADVSIELHFNGGPATARGCETLTSGTSGSMLLAKEIHKQIVTDLPVKDRGIKVLSKGSGRGWQSLWVGRAPAVLLEPYFGSNIADCHMADDYRSVLAESILDGARAAVAKMRGGS